MTKTPYAGYSISARSSLCFHRSKRKPPREPAKKPPFVFQKNGATVRSPDFQVSWVAPFQTRRPLCLIVFPLAVSVYGCLLKTLTGILNFQAAKSPATCITLGRPILRLLI